MTLQAKDFRIGNLLYCAERDIPYQVTAEDILEIDNGSSKSRPIPLTEEWLLKCPNHKRVNGKNILNTIYFEIGRNRVISIGNIGTGNEAIWLCEIDPNIENRITDLVCIHNFDYDGKIMLHKFQNIFHSLTNTELTVNL